MPRSTTEMSLISKERSIQLVQELGLPNGLFPLADIEEVGFHLATPEEEDRTFKEIKRQVLYALDVTAFMEKDMMKKMTGVKTKELLLWPSVIKTYLADPSLGKITFKTGTGLSDSIPVNALKSKSADRGSRQVGSKVFLLRNRKR